MPRVPAHLRALAAALVAVAAGLSAAPAESAGSGVERAVSGPELRKMLTDRVAYGGWPARDNMFTWRFQPDGTLTVDVGGTYQGGAGSGNWRILGDELCLTYPRFVAFQIAWRHRACHRVIRAGTVFRVLDADGSLHAWFALTTNRGPCTDPNVTRSNIAGRCLA